MTPSSKPTEMKWHKGYPNLTYGSEWFIAKLDDGQRVVLTALPEEFTYDFKTADETYYMKYRIAYWMQFTDSEFIPFISPENVS